MICQDRTNCSGAQNLWGVPTFLGAYILPCEKKEKFTQEKKSSIWDVLLGPECASAGGYNAAF